MSPMKYLLSTLIIVSLSGSTPRSVAGPAIAPALTLAENGQARAVIVLGAGLSEPEGRMIAQVAPVLAEHLATMTGGRFEIVKESVLGAVAVTNGRLVSAAAPGGKAIYLLVGEGALTKKLGVTTEGLGPGGIVLKTFGNAVVIMGRGDGTVPGGNGYAVFQFLEALGCRYLWPGELGKVIPRKPTLAVPALDVRYSPAIAQRNIRVMIGGPRNFDKGLGRLGMTQEAYMATFNAAASLRAPGNWVQWQCLGGSIGITGGHAGYGLKGGWTKYGQTHPEWFALQPDGTRDQSNAGGRWRACISNTGLVAQVARDIIEEANTNAQKRCFSLAPNDGGTANYCMCEDCKKLDPPNAPILPLRMFEKPGSAKSTTIQYPSLTDRHVHYWNAVAEKVVSVHPDVLLSVDAYGQYATAPVREKLHPNLVVRYVPSTPEDWKGWQAAGAKRIFWRPNNLHSGYREGALAISAGAIVENARTFAANGMLATDVQGIYHNWASQGLNYYASARIFWNPQLTYEDILDDYCRSGFGPAAEFIKSYFLRAEELRSPYGRGADGERSKMTPEAIAGLKGCLASAAKAAGDDETILKRIAFLAAGLKYSAETAHLYALSLDKPRKDPSVLAMRWASMKALFDEYPLAVNVALVAGHDDPLLGVFGSPDSTLPAVLKLTEKGTDWLFEDQTQTGKEAGQGK